MSFEYIQKTINYTFSNLDFLRLALKAADRNDLEETSDDGNRGLANMGVCTINMVENYDTIVVKQGTKKEVDTFERWTRTKLGRARACETLGFSQYVVQSVRQQHQNPSKTVLAHALSAIIGAVWLDLATRNKTLSDMIRQVFEILQLMDTIVVASEQEAVRRANQSNVAVSEQDGAVQEIIRERDDNFIEPNVDPSRQGSFQNQNDVVQGTVPTIFSLSNPRLTFDSEALNADIDFMQDVSMTDSATIGNIFENAFMLQNGGAFGNSAQGLHGTELGLDDTGQDAANATENPRTAVTSRKEGRLRNNKGRTQHTSLHEGLVRQELSKLPHPIPGDLENYLDHPRIDELGTDATQVMQLRVLYLTMGSSQSLLGFKEILRIAREQPDGYSFLPGRNLSLVERYQEICHLEETEARCVLLRRCHIVKLLEHLCQSNAMIVETPETLGSGHTAAMGNPALRLEATVTNKMLSIFYPALIKGTDEFKKRRAQLTRLRRLAKVLRVLTNTLGFGILALLPCGSLYPETNITDAMLLSITEKRIGPFVELVLEHQGSFLRKLSKAVEPALIALMNGDLQSSAMFPIEYIETGILESTPKGFPGILEYLSQPVLTC